MDYVKAFLIGGLLCLIGQILIDKTKLTPARILVIATISAQEQGRTVHAQQEGGARILALFQPVQQLLKQFPGALRHLDRF